MGETPNYMVSGDVRYSFIYNIVSYEYLCDFINDDAVRVLHIRPRDTKKDATSPIFVGVGILQASALHG